MLVNLGFLVYSGYEAFFSSKDVWVLWYVAAAFFATQVRDNLKELE